MSLKNINGWMIPSTDRIISKKLEKFGVIEGDVFYEKKNRDFLIKQIKKKDVFVDVGANIGMWTRPMSYKFKKVVSLEPAERNLEAFRYNVAGILNVELIQKGAGETIQEDVQFHNVDGNCGGIKLAEISKRPSGKVKEHDFKADIITIDSLELEECDLIKIDVEGYELNVLKGAAETIKRCKPWLHVEKNPDNESECIEFLTSIGGDSWTYGMKEIGNNNVYYPEYRKASKNKVEIKNKVSDLSKLIT
tara:strand:- start:134 stop:880 length:747 start_codon:yes stop_codon:yes gene_type:complete